MGAAAYNRGTAALSRALDADVAPATLTLMRDLTEFSGAYHGTVVFGKTVVRLGPRPGVVTLMNKRETGWRSFGFEYASLWTLAREWRLAFVGFERDEHSAYFRVVPIPEERP